MLVPREKLHDEIGTDVYHAALATRDGERCVVHIRPDLVVQLLARHEHRGDAPRRHALPELGETPNVRRRVCQLDVARLPELAVDPLLADQTLDGLERRERVVVERRAGRLTVASDELARAPLVPGMDDAAVPGRGPPAERLGLEQGHGDVASREL